jgi:beta-mannosidase
VATQSLNGAWQFRQTDSAEWLAAQVPGGVHTDLMAAGRISDPFIGDEELRVQWVAEADWEYRRTFRVEPALAAESRQILAFDGLDTLADVRLNGELLGSADNMFRTWRWDATGRLKAGANELSIVFRSAVRAAATLETGRHMDSANDQLAGAPYLRKAPCHFGWDWGPKLPNVGLWQGVRIEAWTAARIEDVRIEQHHEGGHVRLTAEFTVEREAGAPAADLAASLHLRHPNGREETVRATISAVSSTAQFAVEIAGPQFWWPNGLGGQPLYKLEFELAEGSAGGRMLDARAYKVGLRTLQLRREPDQWGESFTFVVNGVPVFAKGSNWIPADCFPARVTPAQLEALLGGAAAANHNMVRAWGGGYYETEAFFDLCDRFGILVWQDFMFACSVYPLHDPAFLANVEAEVREQVRRLRHRASLALWCGNNEMERGWGEWGWTRPETEDLKAVYLDFFWQRLPAWVAAQDGATPYWPSSPSSGRPLEQSSNGRGDEHQWNVWHSLAPFTDYGRETYRFMSEFGFESLPALATVAAFAPDPADWNLGSPLMDHHQRCTSGNAKILYYMAEQFRLPTDFARIVYVSQILQAEAMRVGVEHWRRHRDLCAGALYWQLNDCWPVSSWASIDYYGRWKALQYATRRFYAPLLLSTEVGPDGVSLAVTNDRATLWRGELRWSLERLSGAVVAAGQEAVEAAPVATTFLPTIGAAAGIGVAESRRDTVLVSELWQPGGEEPLARVVTAFTPDKGLALARPEFEVAVAAEHGRAAVSLTSASLARWVELSLEGADVIFDDNYFDLPSGREVTVGFEPPQGWDIERVRSALRVRSLVDSYL